MIREHVIREKVLQGHVLGTESGKGQIHFAAGPKLLSVSLWLKIL